MTRPKPQLLLVDDDELYREHVSLQLQAAGYRVSIAGGGQEALEMLAQERYDLVLLDVDMPDMSGLQTLERIRAEHSMLSLPVIMGTAYGEDALTIEALRKGANDFLVKPLKIPVVKARIETQLSLSELACLKEKVLRFASHDLKKPLIVALDIAQSLDDELAAEPLDEASIRDTVRLLARTTQGMHTLVEEFLARDANPSYCVWQQQAPVDINVLVQAVLEANQAYAERKGIVLSAELEPSLPMVSSDAFTIRQVLDNLIGNAVKFGSQGGAATVITQVDEHWITVEVRDTGPGLRDEDMQKLFTEGATLSNRPTGGESSSGIGLALSRQFIEGLGGKIGARNNPDKGASFWFRLPR